MKTLYLEKRGCDYKGYNRREVLSDVGNYRVGVYDNSIKGKDGKEYTVEFTGYIKYRYRTISKRGGKELKHPVREVVNENALHIDTEYEDKNERLSFRNIKLEREITEMNLDYTLSGILDAVNYISVDQYDRIVFL